MKHRKKSYREQLQDIVQEYRDTGLPWPAESDQIAQWAISKKKWEPRKETLVRRLAKMLSQAMRDEMFRDPQGRRVRRKHAVPFSKKTSDGTYTQHVMWVDIQDANHDQIHAAFQLRRDQASGDCKQLARDLDSYNENYNKAESIEISFDFTKDVADARHSETYQEPEAEEEDIEEDEGYDPTEII